MDFVIENPVAAPLEDVEAVMFDRETLEALPASSKGLESVKVLSLTRDGIFIERVVHYRPSIHIPRFAMRVPREYTEWTERLRWNTVEHQGEMEITPNMPDAFRRYFHSGGSQSLTAIDATHTIRRLESNLTIEYGIMAGSLAGRIAVGVIKRQFVREGRYFEERANARRAAR